MGGSTPRAQAPVQASRSDELEMLGLTPFLIGDAIKAAAAALLLPAAWKLADGRR